MRKTAFTFLLITLLAPLVLGQDGVAFGQNLRSVLNDKLAESYSNGSSQVVYNMDFSKSPFIFKSWDYAKITFKDGKTVDSLMLNYDDKQSVMLVTMAESINPFTVKTNDVIGFTFYDRPANPYFGKQKSEFADVDKPYGFYQRIYGNDEGTGITVLKTLVKKFRDAEDQINYGSSSNPEGKFDLFTRYYIQKEGEKFTKISLSKKTIQNIIGKGKMKEAQKILKSKRLKWGDEEALVAVLNAYR